MRADVVSLIADALRDLDGHTRVPPPEVLSPETPLFGRDGLLDSLGLVTLIVSVEQAIEDRFGVRVSLADDRAMSQARSPFRTVGALADYAVRLIEEGA